MYTIHLVNIKLSNPRALCKNTRNVCNVLRADTFRNLFSQGFKSLIRNIV